MSLEAAVNSFLRTINPRSYPVRFPASIAYPAIKFNLSGEREKSRRLDGGGLVSGPADMDIHVFDKSYLTAKNMARQVATAINALSTPQAWHGLNIHSAKCTDIRDLPFEQDENLYHVVVEITINLKEA